MENILAIVPAYNEEKSIAGVIDELSNIDVKLDVLVVNDGSTDKTSLVARQTKKAKVLDLPINLGIGGAVQTGFIYALRNNYDIAIQFDGDAQHIASEIKNIIAPILQKEADVVIGSRFLDGYKKFKTDKSRKLGIVIFQFVNSIMNRQRITDSTSGFRAYNRKAIQFFSEYYPTDYPEPEAVILLIRKGFALKEVAVEMRQRWQGISSISMFDGIYYMIKVLLSIFMTYLRTFGRK
ncbi:MAG: glycosyltransferase family 2 protein [Ignavibacteriales bacterium]|nr:glycosyltransferase family 2 protein [Ignavibacteriales bacterium]